MLPKSRGRRDRIASPEYAQLLIEALPENDRALWATAFYAGLRLGEIRALRWSDVDLTGCLLHVRRGWDEKEGAQDPKSEAGQRVVLMAEPLRRELADHGLRTKRSGDDLVFGRTPTLPFIRSTIRSRANAAWEAAGLDRDHASRGTALRRALPDRRRALWKSRQRTPSRRSAGRIFRARASLTIVPSGGSRPAAIPPNAKHAATAQTSTRAQITTEPLVSTPEAPGRGDTTPSTPNRPSQPFGGCSHTGVHSGVRPALGRSAHSRGSASGQGAP